LDVVRNNKRVLVVDDDPDIRNVLESNLTAAGYEVEQASDGVDALGLMTKWRPDLVILDVSMPRLDGWEVARQARADRRLSETPIVFLTGKTDEIDVLKGLSLGAVEYATKPFIPENIVATVAMMVGLMDGPIREERRQKLVNRLTPGRSVLLAEVPGQDTKAGSERREVDRLRDLSTR
jgi:two-component system, sensor histidine kinase and response regulator